MCLSTLKNSVTRNYCPQERVCTISWSSLLVEKMTRALSKEKQENVYSMLQRGYGHREIARVLNVSMGSVHNIRKTYLSNVDSSCGGRPRLLNKEMERSCVLQVTRRSASTIPNVARHVEQDFGILVSAQTVRRVHSLKSFKTLDQF